MKYQTTIENNRKYPMEYTASAAAAATDDATVCSH